VAILGDTHRMLNRKNWAYRRYQSKSTTLFAIFAGCVFVC